MSERQISEVLEENTQLLERVATLEHVANDAAELSADFLAIIRKKQKENHTQAARIAQLEGVFDRHQDLLVHYIRLAEMWERCAWRVYDETRASAAPQDANAPHGTLTLERGGESAPATSPGERPLVAVIRPTGQIIASTRMRMYDEFNALFQHDQRPPKRVVIDLAEVGYIDSSGLATLVSMHRKANTYGCVVSIRDAHEDIHTLLHLTRLDTIFEIEDAPVFRGGMTIA